MSWLNRPTSVRVKVLTLAVLSAGGAVALITTVHLWRETNRAIHQPASQLEIQSSVLAHNAAAPLAFRDHEAAEHLLGSLKAVPEIAAAAIYDTGGRLFATYGHAPAVASLSVTHASEPHMHQGAALHASHPIRLDGETIGAIHLIYDLKPVYRNILWDSVSTAGIGLLGVLTAMLLALRLRRSVTRPIFDLQKTVEAVSRDRNYSIRAVKHTDDDLGALTDGFNTMLRQIQARDTALAEARDRLEEQVADRTADLEQARQEAVDAAASLRRHQAILRTTIESTGDGILVVSSSRCILQVNQRFRKMWGLSETPLIEHNERQALAQAAEQMEDPGAFVQRIEAVYATSETAEFSVELANGRVFEIYSAPLLSDVGVSGRIWSCRDITDRRAAEIERERLNRQLIDSSRRVGMAEVASNVLHNVGNVLNSVNVSVNLINDRLRQSRLTHLSKTADLVHQHRDDLPHFLTRDEHGRHLPHYLSKLADHLAAEQQELIEETASLVESVDHIKQIIATQQSYVQAGDIHEIVDLRKLLTDAVTMNRAALDRHGIALVEEHQPVKPLDTDKHKLLEILINLISNAKYAMTESDRRERVLTLRSHPAEGDDDQIEIQVIDNGVGIRPDDLTRIFSHGYSTRRSGHGYGLHSAALAAHELGGRIVAHSDGPGRGACFTILLPLDATRAEQATGDDRQPKPAERPASPTRC